MNWNLFAILLILNIIACAIAALWVIHDNTYEPWLALVLSLAGLAALYYNSPAKKVIKSHQHIEKVKNSGSINQAGRDIVKQG